MDPGGERRASVEAGKAPDDGEQRVLCGIFGIGRVRAQSATDGVDAIDMGAKE